MSKNLVIVESPAKAKTIEKFLGKDFTVTSCFGHIRDLQPDKLSVDVTKGFNPEYIIPEEKNKVVSELKKLSKNAEIIWLATDEDREGEAISWHLAEVLNLDKERTRRIVFHEITKPAILNAIENPRQIDQHLVDAQQARRILDRLVGFELSPVLWKKVKPSLSAGRVQSVSVRLIVEREREVNQFTSTFSYKVSAIFQLEQNPSKNLIAELPKRFNTFEEAESFLKKCVGASYKIKNLETKPAKKSPAAPFITSTLQQEASRKLGFSVSQTMTLAQKLYEAGHITYMRTDSVNLSDTALDGSRNEITRHFGAEFAQTRKYTTKSAGAQEAHEAIRPTYFENHSIDGDSGQKKLYELIWKRTVASQMADAQIERTIAHIGISTNSEELVATGEVLKFEGFLKVYLESEDDEQQEEDNKSMLPPLKIGEGLLLQEMSATQKFSRPPARYTEASLVKKLEELGIGRPSTYAPTISTIQRRGYVTKEDREGRTREFQQLVLSHDKIKHETKTENTGAEKSKLFPSDIGNVVTDFLLKHFEQIMDYNFTANVEKEFDEIAQGQMKWNKMLETFYNPFHTLVDLTEKTAEKQKGERYLGDDPATGKKVYVKIARFGPCAQIGESKEGEEKPVFASLRPSQMIDSITLEEALDLFKLPRIVGQYEETDIKVSIGRFGPYAQHQSKFYSLPKTDDPYSVDLPRVIEIIEAKRKAEIEKVIKTYPEDPELQVLNGRWGPYISAGKMYYKIPKGKKAENLSYEECKEIVETTEGKMSGRAKKAAVQAAKKAPAKKKSTAKTKKAKKG